MLLPTIKSEKILPGFSGPGYRFWVGSVAKAGIPKWTKTPGPSCRSRWPFSPVWGAGSYLRQLGVFCLCTLPGTASGPLSMQQTLAVKCTTCDLVFCLEPRSSVSPLWLTRRFLARSAGREGRPCLGWHVTLQPGKT